MAASTTQVTTGKVLSPKSLAHVVLRTSNYKSMVSFYKAFLGAQAAHEDEHLAFLRYDEEHHRIAILNVPAASPGSTPRNAASSGMDHMAFTFGSLRDLLAAYRQRKDTYGIVPVWNCNHGITVSCYYQDPDGNRLETQVDAMTVDEANAFMASPAFAENPIGVDFDPEDLLRRLDGGEDEAELLRRGNIGPRGLDSVPAGPPPVAIGKMYEPLLTAAGGA